MMHGQKNIKLFNFHIRTVHRDTTPEQCNIHTHTNKDLLIYAATSPPN